MSNATTRQLKAVHPGKILSEYITGGGLTQLETARRLKVPIRDINGICRGKKGVSPKMSVKLGKFFGTTAELWLNLQKA